jgi:hypothetical protein
MYYHLVLPVIFRRAAGASCTAGVGMAQTAQLEALLGCGALGCHSQALASHLLANSYERSLYSRFLHTYHISI